MQVNQGQAAPRGLNRKLIGLIQAFKQTNSQREQARLSERIEDCFQACGNTLPSALSDVQLQMERIFDKSEQAWENSKSFKADPIDSEYEWNLRKYDLANSKPCTANTLSDLQEVQEKSNLLTVLDYDEARKMMGAERVFGENSVDSTASDDDDPPLWNVVPVNYLESQANGNKDEPEVGPHVPVFYSPNPDDLGYLISEKNHQ